MLALLAKNPLASGLGIGAGILALLLGLQTVRLAWSQGETAAAEKATAAAELALERFKTGVVTETLRVEREAKAKSDSKISELAEEVRSVGLVATQAKTEIRLVPASNGGPCDRDPAYLSMLNGVSATLAAGGAGRDKGQAGPGAAAKVR
ncbi:hypothetical protein [Reyranella sp.]|uniref:hypothetical protein n=1 Tax=Reyranella sp. TaxID=1929291 RepID=UPI003BAD436C